MRLVHLDSTRYEGGFDLTNDDGRPEGGIAWRASHGVLSLDIRGGAGPVALGGSIDLTRDQVVDLIAGAGLALQANDAYWRDADADGSA